MTEERNAPATWDVDWERETWRWEARAWLISTYWGSLEPPPESLRTYTDEALETAFGGLSDSLRTIFVASARITAQRDLETGCEVPRDPRQAAELGLRFLLEKQVEMWAGYADDAKKLQLLRTYTNKQLLAAFGTLSGSLRGLFAAAARMSAQMEIESDQEVHCDPAQAAQKLLCFLVETQLEDWLDEGHESGYLDFGPEQRGGATRSRRSAKRKKRKANKKSRRSGRH